MGYPAAGMRNYLTRLGWGHGDDEFFTTEQALDGSICRESAARPPGSISRSWKTSAASISRSRTMLHCCMNWQAILALPADRP